MVDFRWRFCTTSLGFFSWVFGVLMAARIMIQLIKVFHVLGKEKWIFACLILTGIELFLLLLLTSYVLFSSLFGFLWLA